MSGCVKRDRFASNLAIGHFGLERKGPTPRLRAVDLPPNTGLLWGLEQQEIDSLLAAARLRQFSAKSVIKYQGEPAEQLFLLWEGRARDFFDTHNGKKLNLEWITPGEAFGGAALVSRPSTYLVSSEAVLDSTVLVWDGPTIRGLARRYHQVFENILVLALEGFSWYVAAHAALSSQTAQERLAHIFSVCASSIGHKVDGGIELDVTNEELADAANITHYTASRIINEWQRNGAIRKERGKIFLRSGKGLFRRAA
jgi:CRP/FNR family transcriptional regulator, nitrogen oxide reductase regulator